jgi:hypothetical protein
MTRTTPSTLAAADAAARKFRIGTNLLWSEASLARRSVQVKR